ncbi:MAG: RagB/SusD family nutrient uptake outer membrane protein [FCB group bacterium]|nr:RagB/SusD family nutrient uptake outer membrane protein [FCB group bacterium]
MFEKNQIIRFLVPLPFISLLLWSCTDLEETPYDVVTPSNFYKTEAELTAAVVPVYNSLGGASWGSYMFLQDVASDAIVVPTRGGDWDDGGKWRELQLHTWSPTHPEVNGAWNGIYGGVAKANSTLDNLGRAEQTDLVKTYIAETKVLRAVFYWWLIDLFGDVPLVTDPATDPDNPPAQTPRKDVFDFIVNEIKEALPNLEETHGSSGYGRVTTGAANTLLATLYLNAGVYTGTPMWSETVAACDAVINSGQYSLMPTVQDVFSFDNEGVANTEYILVYATLPLDGVTFFRHQATLHYNQLPSSPWNGFSVLTDFYNSYETGDARLDQILVGQQYVLAGPNAGDSAFDRQGNPLDFQIDFPLINATESDGPRILKWPIDPNMSGWFAGDDYAIFRYSHVLLAKAEAEFNLGNTAEATSLVNQVRERAGLAPLASVTADDIYQERGHELLWEGFRRQDMIRTGHWGDTWSLHDTPSPDYTKLYPIPQIQMDANPNLVQNPGY